MSKGAENIFCSNIWPLTPVPITPENPVICSTTGVSFVLIRQLWVGPGWGTVTGKNKPWLDAWGFQPHPHNSLLKGAWLRMGLKTDLAGVMETPRALASSEAAGRWLRGGAGRRWESGGHSEGTRALHAAPTPCPTCLFIWLFICVFKQTGKYK